MAKRMVPMGLRLSFVPLIAVLSWSMPSLANAKEGFFDSLMEKLRHPLGEDPAAVLPMDDPALPWFQYTTDTLGRRTFLSQTCIQSRDRQYVRGCVEQEAQQHAYEIRVHEQQQRDAEERARKAEEVKASYEADQQRERERLEQQQAALDKIDHDPLVHAKNIRDSRKQITYYRSQISQQHRIGNISGYVDKGVLYNAGKMIDILQRNILNEYSLYRKYGGRRALSQI